MTNEERKDKLELIYECWHNTLDYERACAGIQSLPRWTDDFISGNFKDFVSDETKEKLRKVKNMLNDVERLAKNFTEKKTSLKVAMSAREIIELVHCFNKSNYPGKEYEGKFYPTSEKIAAMENFLEQNGYTSELVKGYFYPVIAITGIIDEESDDKRDDNEMTNEMTNEEIKKALDEYNKTFHDIEPEEEEKQKGENDER